MKSVPVEMDELLHTQQRDPNTIGVARGYRQLPVDLPAFVMVHRLLKDVPADQTATRYIPGLAGWTVEIKVLAGPTIAIRIGHLPDRTVKVFVKTDDEESYEKCWDWAAPDTARASGPSSVGAGRRRAPHVGKRLPPEPPKRPRVPPRKRNR